MAIFMKAKNSSFSLIRPEVCHMVGIPSGWDRLAAQCWWDPEAYSDAIDALLDAVTHEGHRYEPHPDDDLAEFEEAAHG